MKRPQSATARPKWSTALRGSCTTSMNPTHDDDTVAAIQAPQGRRILSKLRGTVQSFVVLSFTAPIHSIRIRMSSARPSTGSAAKRPSVFALRIVSDHRFPPRWHVPFLLAPRRITGENNNLGFLRTCIQNLQEFFIFSCFLSAILLQGCFAGRLPSSPHTPRRVCPTWESIFNCLRFRMERMSAGPSPD
jgi:hypothetical protein